MTAQNTTPMAEPPEIYTPPTLLKPRFRRWEASEYLMFVHGIQIAPATLAKWASVGGGPAFQKVGRIPYYSRVELDRWAAEKLGDPIGHTSQEGYLQ